MNTLAVELGTQSSTPLPHQCAIEGCGSIDATIKHCKKFHGVYPLRNGSRWEYRHKVSVSNTKGTVCIQSR